MVPCTGIAHCKSVCVCYSRGSVQLGSARAQETEDVRTYMICKNKRASNIIFIVMLLWMVTMAINVITAGPFHKGLAAGVGLMRLRACKYLKQSSQGFRG